MVDEDNIPDSLRGQAIEMLVSRAKEQLETADTLAQALRHLVVPQTFATDLYHPDRTGGTARTRTDENEGVEKTNTEFGFEAMIKLFLYRELENISDTQLEKRLKARGYLQRWFGVNRGPTQQTFYYTWHRRFSQKTRYAIQVAARAIENVAVKEGVIHETLAPRTLTEENTENDGTPKREYKRDQTNKTVQLARKHALPHFKTGRADNKKYLDEDIFEMHARMCTTQTAAHTEGEVGWLTDDDYTPDGGTFLRAIKQVGQSEDDDQDVQIGIEDIEDFDEHHFRQVIASVQDDIMRGYDISTKNIIKSIEGENLFDDRVTIAAIDVTPEPFHPSPWEDKDEGIPKEDFPRMVSGYKKDDGVKRGYKYATLTLAGNVPPIILAIEPVKHNSDWEPESAVSHSNAELVDRLLTKAQQHIDLDIVLYDRGINGRAVNCVVEKHGLTYVAPESRYTNEWSNIENIQEHPTADGAVMHDVAVSAEVGQDHEAEQLYVPSRSDDADGKYAVFLTNHGRVEPNEIHHWTHIYRRRWDIENQYKSVKDFLPRTSSKNFRVRFHNFVFAALMYNLWRLTDTLVKAAMDRNIRSEPVLTAKTFSQVIGKFLRRNG